MLRLILLSMLFGSRSEQHTVEYRDNEFDGEDTDCECDDYDYDYPCDSDLGDSYFNGD